MPNQVVYALAFDHDEGFMMQVTKIRSPLEQKPFRLHGSSTHDTSEVVRSLRFETRTRAGGYDLGPS